MDEERRAHLDRVLIGGREPVDIVVVDHDERWAARFGEVADRIRRALSGRAGGVEHIGSTSVPGLAAKPIVDVLLTVADVEDEAAYLPGLESAGFELRVREPGHRMVRTPAHDVHVHVYEPDRPEVDAYLDLRDWLRVDAPDRALYAATKRALARRRWEDMNDYADAKTDVVLEVLGRARAWRAGARAPRGGA
ncbi:GrpB family protein [Blastococcus sp. SYSU D00695]